MPMCTIPVLACISMHLSSAAGKTKPQEAFFSPVIEWNNGKSPLLQKNKKPPMEKADKRKVMENQGKTKAKRWCEVWITVTLTKSRGRKGVYFQFKHNKTYDLLKCGWTNSTQKTTMLHPGVFICFTSSLLLCVAWKKKCHKKIPG